MQRERPQFDCLLGGTETLPHRITFSSFVATRAKEIQIMRNYLHTQSGTKLAFQKLPKHLRRRVMSHNVKRLPRRLRQIHLNQMQKSGVPPKQKRPSRKFRRRPRNLMDEYFRRQMRCKWLKTHIWYAKRFHMVEKWGYKLPDSPCDKAFRACYRATTKHCLMQDISYYHCIELVGKYVDIVEGFKEITDRSVGLLSIGAKAYSSGRREGSTTLFKTGENRRAIGQVDFNWDSPKESSEDLRKLWIWVHVAYYQETLHTLIQSFQLTKVKNIYENKTIKLVERSSELNRIRLTGPLSNAILQEAFMLAPLNPQFTPWFENYLSDQEDLETNLNEQFKYWGQLETLTSPAVLPPRIILPLLVQDPRYNLPKKRTKALAKPSETGIIQNNPNYLPFSPIWDEKLRIQVKNSKLTKAQVDELRSQTLVPDSSLGVGPTVPILLIQRPGCGSSHNLGYGSGWDLILPSEWTQVFWIAFILRGAKVGGLQQSQLINFEMGKLNGLLPDTEAGLKEETDITNSLRETFFKRPPNKRINYNKFSIVSPFICNWKMLINNWGKNLTDEEVDNFTVIRDVRQLQNIQHFLKTKTQLVPDSPSNSLIPIKLRCKKGILNDFAIICLPKLYTDYTKEPVEPKNLDLFQLQRKQLRRDHKTLLKKLRRKRIKAKRSNKKISIDKEMLLEYTTKMRALWLPEPTNIRNSSSREIIGFVQSGGFSLTSGQSVGIGFIARNALSALQKLKTRNKIFVRNTNSRQYRIADFEVITD